MRLAQSEPLPPPAWSDFSLPPACSFIVETRTDGPDMRGLDHQFTVQIARGWISARHDVLTAVGPRFQTYVFADADLTLTFHPGPGTVVESDFFAQLGSALSGTNVSPYDAVRAMIRVAESGSEITTEHIGNQIHRTFSPDAGQSAVTIVSEAATGDIASVRNVNLASGKFHERHYADFVPVGSGRMPTRFEQTAFDGFTMLASLSNFRSLDEHADKPTPPDFAQDVVTRILRDGTVIMPDGTTHATVQAAQAASQTAPAGAPPPPPAGAPVNWSVVLAVAAVLFAVGAVIAARRR